MGYALIDHGYKVLFVRTSELVQRLQAARRALCLTTTTTGRIRRRLVGLKMPRALEALQTTLSRIEQGEFTALEAIEAIEALLDEEYPTPHAKAGASRWCCRRLA